MDSRAQGNREHRMENGKAFCSAAPIRLERKVVEKNRRIHMKSLYSELNSLLPNTTFKEALPLPDQLDEAVNYIQGLQKRLEKSKEKKEKLMKISRITTQNTASNTTSNFNNVSAGVMAKRESLPRSIEIQEMGCGANVVLVTGLDNITIFYQIIRVIREEGAEVMHASFEHHGNSVLQIVRETGGNSLSRFDGVKLLTRLKEVINGSSGRSTTTDIESQVINNKQPWDYGIEEVDIWEAFKMFNPEECLWS